MIRILPLHVANKIAAGEVIERPASVVKELVENSLDAGAGRILVELEEGGKRLIRVTDDGEGMSPEDLALAFVPHATSKIESVDDLFRVASYGFRGEALASIGSVARASILSRRPGEPLGHRVTCERSEISAVLEAGGPEGTRIEARDLFYNTPARRKFLKTDSAEVARTSEMITRLALPVEDVHFELRHNGRVVLACERVAGFRERVLGLYGRELEGKLVEISHETEGLSVGGIVALPDAARASSNRQFVFLNGRFIRDKSVQAAVARAFDGFLMPRLYPVYFVRITIDPGAVDVNVHPTKVEVRFRDRNAVFSAVQRACRQALEAARPSGSFVARAAETGAPSAPREVPTGRARPYPVGERPATAHERVAEMESMLFPPSAVERPVAVRGRGESPTAPATASDRPASPGSSGSFRFMQIHRSYILVEDDDGFYIVDQHALHERMLFEQLKERSAAREALGQRLLVPEVVELAPAEYARIIGMTGELADQGLIVAPFGGHSIAVEEVPLELAKASPRRLIEAALDAAEEDVTREFDDARSRLLATMACRSAVKFNERLRDDQIRSLLEWERGSPHSAACPHGRPTRIRITLAELERQFLRKK